MIGRVAVWLLIAFVLFTVFRQFDNTATAPMNAEQTSYTQFMQDAKDGKIRRVDVQGRKITVTPVEGASYVITSPGDLWMVDDLRKNGVQVFGKPEEEPSFLQTILVSWFPMLLLIGGLDDYIKVFRHRKEGLKGRFKIVGQVGLGVIVGTTMWLSPDIVVREKVTQPVQTVYLNEDGTVLETVQRHVVVSSESLKTTQTTIPFVKNNEFDYGWLTGGNSVATWILYVLVAIFVVTAVSNGANLTDGLDGLATGVSVPIVAVLGVLAYLSGHIVYADYLNIMYIPGSGEMVVFAAALVGALVGFLWYNSFPAQIFMGDTGSLAIGGVIAVFALCIRKELLLPLLCGVFLVESFSVMMQVGWFKYTKRRYGEGRRILLMSPVHHHYQKKGIFETKIVLRFWIISLLLAAITLVTLKIR